MPFTDSEMALGVVCCRAGAWGTTLARVEACTGIRHALNSWSIIKLGNPRMVWTTPTLEEICIGLEINGYLPAEF
jgi:coenzyme PQQ precursor peptide PqqA